MNLPDYQYDIILSDPPWDYSESTFLNSGNMHNGVDVTSHVTNHYPTMTFKELCDLDVKTIANPTACLLFMWTTGPQLAQAIKLGQAWGFKYVTVGFVWHKKSDKSGKEQVNPGSYTMSSTEQCLVFKLGRIPGGKKTDEVRRGARNVRQWLETTETFEAPRARHSQKPLNVHERIEEMFPDHRKFEMFARDTRPTWDVWGNDEKVVNANS